MRILKAMNKRKYDQVCALSASLDIIGERWTLMIIRELIFGSRRYSDILRGTPGLGTNLLAQRLKELEEANLIQRRKLPPPAASSVYELTEYGRNSLIPIIRAMTNMGVDFLPYPPREDQFVPASSTMGALSTFFLREQAANFSGSAEFNSEADVFHFAAENGVVTELGFGTLPEAELKFRGATAVYMGLIVGYISVEDALANQELEITQGSLEQAVTFFNQFAAEYEQL